MVRINIQLEEAQARRLSARARAAGKSQAAIVRELLAMLPPASENEDTLLEESFGAWRGLTASCAARALRGLRKGRSL